MEPHIPIDVVRLAQWLKVLAEPKRLNVLNLLMEGIHCNCELGEQLEMAPNLISHHLRVLRDAGLVIMERDVADARWVYYSVNEDSLRELNAVFDQFFSQQRIQPRRPNCGPQKAVVSLAEIPTAA